MRRVRYSVAMSLDGYIAGPHGEVDWIAIDPEINFGAMFDQFDTVLMGRRTYEQLTREGRAAMPGLKTIVFSRTLQTGRHPQITIWDDIHRDRVTNLKASAGKDIWLFGGSTLFRSLVEQGLVDTVEVAVIPILLGSGIPLIAPAENCIRLQLRSQKVYKTTGTVLLEYAVRWPQLRSC